MLKMNISITNFKNISNLNLDLNDNKVNLVLGVSGSGKTSIVEGLLERDFSFNKKIGQPNDPVVLLDGQKPNSDSISYFSSEEAKSLLTFSTNEETFELLIDDNSNLKKAKQIYDSTMAQLMSNLAQWNKINESLKEIRSKYLGSTKITKNNSFSKSSPIMKFKANYLNTKAMKSLSKQIDQWPKGKLEWQIKGIEFIVDKSCPFCKKSLNKKILGECEHLKSLDAKQEEKMHISNDLKKIGQIDIPLINEFELFSKKLIDIDKAICEYEEIQNHISILNSEVLPQKYSNGLFKKREHAYEFFPQLKESLSELNKNYKSFIKSIKKIKSLTSECIRNNTKKINSILTRFGIPYKIKIKTEGTDKISSAYLYHKKDSEDIDRTKSLSNGEKNIVALAIWLISNIHNSNRSLIILDDPVSDYDDGKRQTMLQLMQQHDNKTILILTYDQVLAKLAVSSIIPPKCQYMVNHDGIVSFTEINKNSFVNFSDVLENLKPKISSGNYLQKILYLRNYGECHWRATLKYSYLSGIYHFLNKPTIDNEKDLKEKISTAIENEDDIINEIEKLTDIHLDHFSSNLILDSDTTDYSLFEKAMIARERTAEKSSEHMELSNMIHLNSRLLISLDPFIYPLCSPSVFAILQKIKGKVSSLPERFHFDD